MSGCVQKYNLFAKTKIASEAIYGWGDGFAGIMGKPVQLRGALEFDLSDDTELCASYSVADTYKVSAEVEHKVSKNWSVKVKQTFDSADVAESHGPYHIGFEATYKL